MISAFLARMRPLVWRLAHRLHDLDFALVLPLLARLPLGLGFLLADWRGRASAALGRDWRSMALGRRHIRERTRQGLRLIAPTDTSDAAIEAWCRGRYRTEAREEFEAALIARGRVPLLSCTFDPPEAATLCRDRTRGLVLVTSHFNSMFLAIAFLARSGGRVNLLTSGITHDPRVHPAVQSHFTGRVVGTEQYLNGGRLLNFEEGVKPFYDMLDRGETVVIVGDGPAPLGKESLVTDFFGYRHVARGAMRMAQRTQSDFGACILHATAPGHYRLALGPVGSPFSPPLVDACYRFMAEAILARPDCWWAADLMPDMPPAEPGRIPESLPAADPLPAAGPFPLPGCDLIDGVLAGQSPLVQTDEFALGFRQWRDLIPVSRWWHPGGPDASVPVQDVLMGTDSDFLLVIPNPAVIVSHDITAELMRVCRETGADFVLPADPRVATDPLAIDYASREGFDRYVRRRGRLDSASVHDGRTPWFYLARRSALVAVSAQFPDASWADFPGAGGLQTVTANRAFVHGFMDYQQNERAEMLELLPPEVKTLLDVGGGEGGFAACFQTVTGGRAVVAEPNPPAASAARARGLEVHCGRFESFHARLSFDCVSFLDVLEHLPDPADALRRARALLRSEGYLLISVPNVGHWSVVDDLLDGEFTYLPVGILCAGHLRFFTRTSLEALLRECGFEAIRWRNPESCPPARFMDRLAAGVTVNQASLSTFSFHVLARKS